MRRKLTFVCLLTILWSSLSAQDMRKMLSYDFIGARSEYRDSLASVQDSALRVSYEEALRKAENAVSLSEYCHIPKVLIRKRMAANSFYLKFPFPDKSWHEAADTSGYRNIVLRNPSDTGAIHIRREDSLYVFCVTCGQERYFSSKDLYGMGGYDLYVQRRNPRTGAWGEPQNLGFPYSSPFDDFLFVNTGDGRYSLFASNRGCPQDSVNVYVLEYEPVPVRKPVDRKSLGTIADLNPISQEKEGTTASAEEEDPNTRLYREKLSAVASARAEVEKESAALESLRDEYAGAASSERQALAGKLMEGERKLAAARTQFKNCSESLNALEMKFIREGINIDPGRITKEENPKSAVQASDFRFSDNSFGESLSVIWD